LKVVSGDISAEGLGISEEDKLELTENVNIIFHCAAVVRFDYSLIQALKTNLKGTHRILQLAEISTQLKSFVYVSTSFCQAYQTNLEERYYSTGFDVFALIGFIESNDKRSIDDVEKE
jgi:alcohol-forming fatty acyl-CoA reductase